MFLSKQNKSGSLNANHLWPKSAYLPSPNGSARVVLARTSLPPFFFWFQTPPFETLHPLVFQSLTFPLLPTICAPQECPWDRILALSICRPIFRRPAVTILKECAPEKEKTPKTCVFSRDGIAANVIVKGPLWRANFNEPCSAVNQKSQFTPLSI